MYGFYRVAAAVPSTIVADTMHNTNEAVELAKQAHRKGVQVLVFPELTFTGYSCGDLLMQAPLYRAQIEALSHYLEKTRNFHLVSIVGVLLQDQNRLYNCALVLQSGKILGVVPKTHLPNKNEFYEKRQLTSGKDVLRREIRLLGQEVPFGVDLVFKDETFLSIGVELCEDLWVVEPPSGMLAAAGATLLCNLSASNAVVGKASYRESLVCSQSARTVAAYVYASSGVGESSTDTTYDGDAMVCENGLLLARSQRFAIERQLVVADVDLQRLRWQRISETMMGDTPPARMFREIPLAPLRELSSLNRRIDPTPFVPSDANLRKERCKEIIAIQSHALIKRLDHIGTNRTVIGVSGGLDSTLALLSTFEAYRIKRWDLKGIYAVTMPGFGTTSRTLSNAKRLCEALGVRFSKIDISQIAQRDLDVIEHDGTTHDVTFENVQARARTSILMNLANKTGGIVIGTGDMSEAALGWSTYNGDHMSMYALNIGIPKTLVRYLVAYFKEIYPNLEAVLKDILDTPVSPELLPHRNDTIAQETESIIGPYELHDFFLYHFLKYGASPQKILYLAALAFEGRYDKDTIRKWLEVFFVRFFANQFKRSCMPDGPKVGTVALSPRSDWRMPSDASVKVWLEEIQSNRIV